MRPQDGDAPRIAARLSERAFGYLGPSDGPVVVRLESVSLRPASRLYWFAIEAPTNRRRIVVKQPLPRAFRVDRPRLALLTPAPDKARYEFRALSAIDASLRALPDSRLVAVEPLDLFDDLGAVVVGVLEGRSLRQLFAFAMQRRPGARAPLLEAMERTGAWLARFHALSLPGEEHHTNPEGLAMAALTYGQYLRAVGVLGEAAATVDARVATALQDIPEPWPLGPGHGDMAMRNVLATPEGSVGVIDVLARWQVPVYEDLAYFLLGLRTPFLERPWLRGFGGERLANCAAWAFLQGYFGGRVAPVRAIAAYQCLLLLDRWSASVDARPGQPWRRVTDRLRNRAYRSLLRRLLATAEAR